MNKKIAALCIVTCAGLTACGHNKDKQVVSPNKLTADTLTHATWQQCMNIYKQKHVNSACLPVTKPTKCDQATYDFLKQQQEPICSNVEDATPTYLWLANWKQCFKVSKDSNNTATWCLPTERQQNCPANTFEQLKKNSHLSCSNKQLIPAPEWTQYPASCFGKQAKNYQLTVCRLTSKPADCDSGEWNKLQKDNGILMPSCQISNTFKVNKDNPSFNIQAPEALDGGITAEDPKFDDNLIKYNGQHWVTTGGTMPGNPGGYNVFQFTATKKMLEKKNQTSIQIDSFPPGGSTPIWITYYLVTSDPK